MVNLILGTATFETGYGIANKRIRLESEAIHKIITTAQNLGIKEFDTAPVYGGAELQLGLMLNHDLGPKISSKISKEDAGSVKLMLASVRETLLRTKVAKLTNLYLHDSESLAGPKLNETVAGLKELIGLGLVERVGVSAYSLQSVLRAKELIPELSVFQVPENICDRRMLNSIDLVDLKRAGNHLNVRSIFLQGLLLMSLNEIPPHLKRGKIAISQLRALSDSSGVSVLQLCLGYGQTIPWANALVIGAASASQLTQIIESNSQLPIEWESNIDTLPEEVLDPRRW